MRGGRLCRPDYALSVSTLYRHLGNNVMSMQVGLLPLWLPRSEGASPPLSLLIPLYFKAGVAGMGPF